jgi:hypothetical protein
MTLDKQLLFMYKSLYKMLISMSSFNRTFLKAWHLLIWSSELGSAHNAETKQQHLHCLKQGSSDITARIFRGQVRLLVWSPVRSTLDGSKSFLEPHENRECRNWIIPSSKAALEWTSSPSSKCAYIEGCLTALLYDGAFQSLCGRSNPSNEETRPLHVRGGYNCNGFHDHETESGPTVFN